MRSSDLPNELIDRGIYWQVGGFTLAAVASVTILAEFSGSELRAFIYFEIAVTKLYWALVIPLAGLFDGARKMFEKMSDIRAKRRQRWLDEGRGKVTRKAVGKVTRKAAGKVTRKAAGKVTRKAAARSVSACVRSYSGSRRTFRRRLWHLYLMSRTTPASKGARRVFEKMSDIRAKRRQRWLGEGRRQERERMREELRHLGVTLPQEAIDYLEGKGDKSEPQNGC